MAGAHLLIALVTSVMTMKSIIDVLANLHCIFITYSPGSLINESENFINEILINGNVLYSIEFINYRKFRQTC